MSEGSKAKDPLLSLNVAIAPPKGDLSNFEALDVRETGQLILTMMNAGRLDDFDMLRLAGRGAEIRGMDTMGT